jgi:hypothetical protein
VRRAWRANVGSTQGDRERKRVALMIAPVGFGEDALVAFE